MDRLPHFDQHLLEVFVRTILEHRRFAVACRSRFVALLADPHFTHGWGGLGTQLNREGVPHTSTHVALNRFVEFVLLAYVALPQSPEVAWKTVLDSATLQFWWYVLVLATHVAGKCYHVISHCVALVTESFVKLKNYMNI